jgi:hypothetical protein
VNGTTLGLTLCALLALPIASVPGSASAAQGQDQPTDAKIEVSLELRSGEGTQSSRATVQLDSEARIQLDDAHELTMTVSSASEDRLSVTLSMRRGAETLVESKTVTASAGQPAQVKVSKDRVLSLQVSPFEHRIDLPDSNEPLAGL